ncbi:MAG: hypothetical protein ACRD3D_04950 [Terriglobia bacterium]
MKRRAPANRIRVRDESPERASPPGSGRTKLFKSVSVVVALLALGIVGLRELRSQAPQAPDVRELMTPAQFQAYGLSKLSQAQIEGFDAWFSGFVANLLAENRNTTAISTKDFPAFEGAVIIAHDGQHLGKITLAEFDADSIVNELGPYGSFVSATSMFNRKCPYGGTLSRLSPFNPHTSIPPRIYNGGKFVGYLSVNEMKAPRVDPYALVGWLRVHQ